MDRMQGGFGRPAFYHEAVAEISPGFQPWVTRIGSRALKVAPKLCIRRHRVCFEQSR